MRVIYTLLLITGTLFTSQAQVRERIVTGVLRDEGGNPLPGVNILVKGTSVGTTTDINGNYSIKAPIGGILVFSFIGMTSKEVVVTEENFAPARNKEKRRSSKTAPQWSPFLMQDSTANPEEGVAILNNETPFYRANTDNLNPESIKRIKRVRSRGALPVYRIKTMSSDAIEPFKLQYSINLGIDRANRFPSLQNTFSQGRAVNGGLQWRGAEEQEIFSWGPRIDNLEFDGSEYPFDDRGKLVIAGSGNGVQAKAHNPLSFFQTGHHSEHFLTMSIGGPQHSTMFADVGRQTIAGIIRGSKYERTTLSLQSKRIKFSNKLDGDLLATFNSTDADLSNRGANLATIVGSAYRTPATFDNANGFSPRHAYENPHSYRLEDGTVRSHAPGFTDNPYGLGAEIPDEDHSKRFLGGGTLRYTNKNAIDVLASGNFERQWNKNRFGLLPGHAGYADGRLTKRDEIETVFSGMVMPSFQRYTSADIKIDGLYQFRHETRELSRLDAFQLNPTSPLNLNEAGVTSTLDAALQRTTHEVSVNARYQTSAVTIRGGNRAYFSNTLSKKEYVNFFPSIGLSWMPTSTFYDMHPFEHMKIFGSWARTIHEASLLYGSPAYLSTALPTENYNQYYESKELFFQRTLAPEVEQKFEVGIDVNVPHFTFYASLYKNVTDDFIAPVINNDTPTLVNVAKITNSGTNLKLTYQDYRYGNFNMLLRLGFSKYNTVATKLYSDLPYIPIAGFASAASVIAEGEAIGTLYGTTYVRNEKGERVIGSDGFPLVDSNMKKIGNSIPDYTLTFEPELRYKTVALNMVLEYRRGGDRWNGTQAALDYFGRSSHTAAQRNTTDYIFDGVQEDGQPNTTPVDFYDATKPMSENRWVRYGFTGVGEDYIEDASFFRMTEVALSFRPKIQNKIIKETKIVLTVRNLFLITPYRGVDPSTTLFGYATGSGLDLFNTPTTRSFSLLVNVKI